MKIAHLILAHKNPAQLFRMVQAMDHPAFDFYIHVDKKINDLPFKKIFTQKNVFFIKNRTKIYWGDWGTIQATINGFEAILPGRYAYINVMSAQDFPIKSPDTIYKYFASNAGAQYITCDRIEGAWSDAASRITEYHLINWRFPGRHRLEKIISMLLPKRVFPLDYIIAGRANWFSITSDAALYSIIFLREHPQLVKYFKYCWGADEFIFSTILYNSYFRESIRDNLVYVDWNSGSKGHPKLLTSGDFDQLKTSGKLFARKFDMEADSSIFTLLETMIKQQ